MKRPEFFYYDKHYDLEISPPKLYIDWFGTSDVPTRTGAGTAPDRDYYDGLIVQFSAFGRTFQIEFFTKLMPFRNRAQYVAWRKRG